MHGMVACAFATNGKSQSGRQVGFFCCSLPVAVVLLYTIQYGLCVREELCHCLEKRNAHNAEEAELQHNNNFSTLGWTAY